MSKSIAIFLINPFPHTTNLTTNADDIEKTLRNIIRKPVKMQINLLYRVEDIVAKGEIAHYIISNYAAIVSKNICKWERG